MKNLMKDGYTPLKYGIVMINFIYKDSQLMAVFFDLTIPKQLNGCFFYV